MLPGAGRLHMIRYNINSIGKVFCKWIYIGMQDMVRDNLVCVAGLHVVERGMGD